MKTEYSHMDTAALQDLADNYSEKWHCANDAQLTELKEEVGDRLHAVLGEIQRRTGKNYRPAREVETL